MGPKPKKKENVLGRPDRGSIYEIAHPDFPGPTKYYNEKNERLLNITG